MKLTFLGTRGNIDPESARHRYYTALMVAYRGREVMIDCGEGWGDRLDELRPAAIVVTHAHPDHVDGLDQRVDCPVFATEVVWETIEDRGIDSDLRRQVDPGRDYEIEGIGFRALTLRHSVNAPAVGYRIEAGRVTVFYAPDVARIDEREKALDGCQLYVGDGATVDGHLLRRSEGELIGHVSVRDQLDWCREAGVERMIVTHCGSQIVKGERDSPQQLRDKLERYSEESGVGVEVARDGMERVLR